MTENILTILLILPWIFIAYNFGYFRGSKDVIEKVEKILGDEE